MQLLPHKGALAIAAVVEVALNTHRRPVNAKRLAGHHHLPPRSLEPLLQALVHHGILKSNRGPRGGYELAREQRRITADDILRAAGTAAETECTPFAGSALLNTVVMPAVAQAEHAFSAALASVNVENLARSAAALQNSSGPHDESPPRSEEWLRANQPLPVSHQEHSNANGVFQPYPRRGVQPMDWNRVEGNWKQVKGKIKEKWGRLTEDDLDVINGRRDHCAAMVSAVPTHPAYSG